MLGTAAELRDYAATKTVDKLLVDSSHKRGAQTLTLNIDLTLTDLACHEIVTKVTDGHGHALAATDANTLHKLRVDAAGAPLDAPRLAQWNSSVAPIFHQRKLVSLMGVVREQLGEAMARLHDHAGAPTLSPLEMQALHETTAEQAALLQGRLDQLTDAAQLGFEVDDEHANAISLSLAQVKQMRDEVARAARFSDAQRKAVVDSLHAIHASLEATGGGGTNGTDHEQHMQHMRSALHVRNQVLLDTARHAAGGSARALPDRLADMNAQFADIEQIVGELSEDAPTRTGVAETLASIKKLIGQASEAKVKDDAEALPKYEAEIGAALQSLVQRLEGTFEKPRLPEHYCGSCYGAGVPNQCCNSCDAVYAAFAARRLRAPERESVDQCMREDKLGQHRLHGESCNLFGSLELPRITTSFLIGPVEPEHDSDGLIAKLLNLPTSMRAEDVAHFNVSHRINRLSFGADFPGQTNPLDRVESISPTGPAVSRRFLKVVPTTYEFLDGRTVTSDQFSVTEYFRPLRKHSRATPSISFTVEMTPLRVEKREVRGGSVVELLARLAALLGGLYTGAAVVDSLMFYSAKAVKARLGKGD